MIKELLQKQKMIVSLSSCGINLPVDGALIHVHHGLSGEVVNTSITWERSPV